MKTSVYGAQKARLFYVAIHNACCWSSLCLQQLVPGIFAFWYQLSFILNLQVACQKVRLFHNSETGCNLSPTRFSSEDTCDHMVAGNIHQAVREHTLKRKIQSVNVGLVFIKNTCIFKSGLYKHKLQRLSSVWYEIILCTQVLRRLAKCLQKQHSYQLATKKFTQVRATSYSRFYVNCLFIVIVHSRNHLLPPRTARN